MIGEALVLDGHDRQFHAVGDPIGGNLPAALGVDPGDRASGRVEHRRDRRHLAADDVRRTLGHQLRGVIARHPEAADDRKQQCGGEHAGQQAQQRHSAQSRPRRGVLIRHPAHFRCCHAGLPAQGLSGISAAPQAPEEHRAEAGRGQADGQWNTGREPGAGAGLRRGVRPRSWPGGDRRLRPHWRRGAR